MRFAVVVLLVSACGPVGGEPEMIGLSDQAAFVGNELIVELRASDPDLEILRFSFDSNLPDLAQRAVVEHTGNGAALFRWTPMASDVGTWAIDFKVTDGKSTTSETVLVEVRAVAEGAPVFRKPLAVGATLDLEQSRCLELDIEVEDPDTSDVDIAEVEPILRGSQMVQETGSQATWTWCPSDEQIAESDRHVLILSADDRDNPPTVKHFLIVLRGEQVATPVDLGGFTLEQTTAACSLTLPEPTLVAPGGSIIIARDANLAEFEAFWGVTLEPNVLFVSSNDTCPRINGDEAFTLRDSAGAAVDGPTVALDSGTNLQRISHEDPAGSISSWNLDDLAPLDASPGIANRDVGSGAVYITEVSDAPGSGNFVFEFVEISVD